VLITAQNVGWETKDRIKAVSRIFPTLDWVISMLLNQLEWTEGKINLEHKYKYIFVEERSIHIATEIFLYQKI
jgi:hypothetical protein